MVEGVQSYSARSQGGTGGNTFKILVFLPISFFLLSPLFVPLFSGVGKEVRREWRMLRKDIGVRKGDRQL
jgi:hypothetical protein